MERQELTEHYDDVPLTDCTRCGHVVGNPDWADAVWCPACARDLDHPRTGIAGPRSREMDAVLASFDARWAARKVA